MAFGDKIKALRKEKGWTQDDLSQKIGGDARQISRYENGKFMPSAEVIIKIAQVFDASIDFLLLDDAPRRPLIAKDNILGEKYPELESLTEEDKNSLRHIIDALVARNKIRKIASGM